MKTTGLCLCLALGFCSAASAAELLWSNFDTAPTGSVANLPGWTRAAWLGGITGRVANINAYHSPSNILVLPRNNAGSSSAVFTNFNSTYNPTNEHPVIRCSAKLVTPSNIFFQLGLRDSASGAFLSFQPTNNFGGFGFLAHDWIIFPLVHDRFVDVTFFYNRSNNSYRLDYDYTNRIPWIANGEGGATATRFNQFVFARFSAPTNPTSELFLDDVSVETFPPHVWAWWRCTSIATRHFVEQLGTFPPTRRASVANAAGGGATDPVWDGQGDAHNEGASRQLVANATNCAIAIPASTNWTVESVFRISAATQNVAFLDWGRGNGSTATGAWINVAFNANGYVDLNLRDSQQAGATFSSLALRYFTPNGRWQHLAVVKSNANLTLYVDYQFVTNRTLVAPATGAYAFGTDSRAAVGISLGGANQCDANSFIDEVRISGKALVPAEFLQPGQPLIVDIDNSPTGAVWQLTMKGILGKSYRVETSPSLGPDANWQYATSRVADYTFNYIDVPGTAPKTNFVRVLRTD